MKMTVSCLLFVVVHILGTSGAIQFTSIYNGTNITGVVGFSANITWRFSGGVRIVDIGLPSAAGSNLFTILASTSKPADSVPSIPPAYTGRVSVSGDVSSGQVIFTLSNISQTDERLYGCRITPVALGSALIDTVNLVVTETPKITHPTTANANYNEGSHIIISCETTGKPDADVRWIHDGQEKSSGSKTAYLTFSTISKADAGIYTCRANNSAGIIEKQLNVVVNYPATIESISSSVSKSWIGQTVMLNCQSDGVPIPTMSWYSPNGNKFNPVKAKENNVDVTMNSDRDFGHYNCTAVNTLATASRTVLVQEIKAPGSPMITSTDEDIQATSLTVKWDPPADVGGSPITAYRVVILQGATEIKNDNITNVASVDTRTWPVGNLKINTNYTMKVFARNYVFEGNAAEKEFQTKFEDSSPTSQPQTGGINTAVIASAAAAGVLVIAAVIILVVWLKRRKTAPSEASPSETALQSNPDEIEGGYQVAAARGLQASAAAAEPNYVQVDVSQKKKNRRPVTDEYAQVDKSKKTKKKPKKQPDELVYAELDNFMPKNRPAPAQAAAADRLVVRPPAYEGAVYADIEVFGRSPPDATYFNVPKKDVVYSNVERM